MLTHTGTQTIQTKRLTLRKFTPDDAHDMFENWAKDPRVSRFLTWVCHESEELTKALIEGWCAEYEKNTYYNWVIELDGHAVGNISVVRIKERAEEAELGYCISAELWGKGLMTEAASAVRDFLFREVGFNRICISHALKNPGSGRVAQKCRLTLEGVSREAFRDHSGERHDLARYAILRSEWEKLR